MKLLNSAGPNPRMVRMFLAEKGITLPTEEINLFAGENRAEAYKKKNPGGTIPALELDDGTVIGETVSICGYLEEIHPRPALIGSTAQERAETNVWVRRVEQQITENMYSGFRYAEGLPMFKDRMRCLPEASSGLKTKAQDGLAWLDGLMQGKTYICGDRLTLADLVLYCCLDFAISVGQPLSPELKNLSAWFKRMDARPSAVATIAPNWKEVGMRI
jgi:glutathione S-transferase